MDDPHDELAALAAQVRTHLELMQLRGATGEPAGPPPVLDPSASPPAEGAVLGAWSGLAATSRERTVRQDGHGQAGLAHIRDELGDCRRCGLCEGRTNLVYGVGDADADLFIVGEGPGYNEDRLGEPFVGKAGQMLDKMLTHVLSLPREAVYISNVVKCRPPDNRNPTADEIARCLPFLERQIRALRPKLVLVLGSVALRSLFPRANSITRARGQWMEHQGIPVMPTFHPAYLLRNPEHKRATFADLKALRARYDELGGRR